MAKCTHCANLEVDKHVWGISFDSDGQVEKVRCGNWSDVGWNWDGTGKDLNTFMVRMANSTAWGEFKSEMENEGVPFATLKGQMLEDPEDAMYALTGDNVLWHFGEHEPDYSAWDDYLKETYHATDEEIEEFKKSGFAWSHNAAVDYDKDFKKSSVYREVLAKYTKLISDANSYDEYHDAITDSDFKMEVITDVEIGFYDQAMLDAYFMDFEEFRADKGETKKARSSPEEPEQSRLE
jgi:hypothetical protein